MNVSVGVWADYDARWVKGTWHPEMVELRIRSAARALRVSKSADSRFRGGLRATWVDGYADTGFNTGYGYERAHAAPAKASSAELQMMDEALEWVKWLQPARVALGLPIDTGLIVWDRAQARSWSKIALTREYRFGVKTANGGGKSAIPGGNSHVSLRDIYVKAVSWISDELNRKRVPVRISNV